jgi:tripartite-type tricarboxylate transporter receptor subunit TctC
MKHSRRTLISAALALSGLTGLTGLGSDAAQAQSAAATWPSRPVRMILPFPPGGASDPPARIISAWLTQQTGQQFLLDNRPGASGIIGVEAVVRSASDGHTLLVGSASNLIVQALFRHEGKPLPYEMVDGFNHIAMYGITSSVIVANPKVPAGDLKELVALLKAKPASLTYGSPGNGTASHLAMEMFKQHLGVDIVHVPYKAAATASVDLLSGQIDLSMGAVHASLAHIKAGKLRPIAVTARTRSAQLPDIPSVNELYPGYESTGWSGLSAPAQTPREVVDKLAQLINTAVQDTKTREAFLAVGNTPQFIGPQDMRNKLRGDLERYAQVVKQANLKID